MAKFHVIAALALGSALITVPALADVKAGVDAWNRGDYKSAVAAWNASAEQGDPDALFNLGQAYKLGYGVKQDLAKAETLFGQAAARNHLQAADNYGLLLFQRGEQVRALPYIQAAASRGDPRAAYLLGIGHFNGDIVAKDWVRAYALATLAQQGGLEQAKAAIAQMDQYIPIDQRQQGVALAAQMADEATANRARQMAAADLGAQRPAVAAAPAAPLPQRSPVVTSVPNSGFPPPSAAVAAAARAASGESARTAGADYARPTAPPPRPAAVAVARPAPRPVAADEPAAAPAPRAVASGPWRVQLGAFGVPGNAEAMWARVRGRPELAGHGKLLVPAGSVTKLQAGGFASEADARNACARLSAAGFSCLATR